MVLVKTISFQEYLLLVFAAVSATGGEDAASQISISIVLALSQLL